MRTEILGWVQAGEPFLMHNFDLELTHRLSIPEVACTLTRASAADDQIYRERSELPIRPTAASIVSHAGPTVASACVVAQRDGIGGSSALAFVWRTCAHVPPIGYLWTPANESADPGVLGADAGSRATLARKADTACGTSCMDTIALALGGILTQVSERSSLNPPETGQRSLRA
jgi:hypothetical protein